MIFFLLLIVAIILLGVSYTLIYKQEIFFTLITKNEENQSFLKTYGLIYSVLGIVAFVIAFFDHKTMSMLYLAVMMVISASFSLLIAQKMKHPKV